MEREKKNNNQLIKELGKLNRSIKILSRCKSAIIQEEQEGDFLDRICKIIGEVGRFPFVWIGFEDPELKKIVLKAKWGYNDDYKSKLIEEGHNDSSLPSNLTLKSGEIQNISEIQAGKDLNSWQNEAIMNGLYSVITFPLKQKEKTIGVITIYAGTPNAFGPQKTELFSELANDVSAGVLKLRGQTEELKIREALKDTEARYSGLFENTGTGTILIEDSGVVSFSNSTFSNYTGYSKQEITDKMLWADFIHDEDKIKMWNYHQWRRKEPGRAPDIYECRMVTKDGSVKNMLMKVGMISDTKISIASFMDITFAKLAEDRLRQSESQLGTIIENFDGMIYVCDMDYHIEFMNKHLIKIKGGDKKGGLCYKVFHDRDKPCTSCERKSLLKGKSVNFDFQKYNNWYHSIISPIIGTDGTVTKIQSIVRDITNQKRNEIDLIHREKNLIQENKRLRSAIKDRYKFGDLIGKCQAMQEVYELIIKAAEDDANIIIYGESGTGKELVAKAIHDTGSRSNNNFVPVNCGAINENIIESEFFGYKKGAFTGALEDKPGFLNHADKGTLFLDEIGEIGLNMQVKLLRVLSDGGYTPVGGNKPVNPDLRIIAATNRNLVDLVKRKEMREDFFYRIHIIPINLPPLRERKEDLPLLVDHFMKKYSNGKKNPAVTGKLLESIMTHDWPGNIRELQNFILRYISLKEVDYQNAFSPMINQTDSLQSESPDRINGNLGITMSEYEKKIITNALQKCQWNRNEASSILGIHRKTLFSKMKKYNMI
ncbi:MAG: PAS domain S-box protein [Desulfobacterales bacterium]|nr:PAS domain S-box protein [Desulfobacterales bacterium]